MRDILDPVDRWIGIPGTESIFGNKPPVAVSDTVSVLKDSGAITIDVLANDFDPEGGAVTLISASAALGSAVAEANGTVTYTPPAGISGFDTVVYEIADPQDQRRNGQVNITITEPQLSIATLPDNTMVLSAETGALEVTITQPAEFAGTYQLNSADMATGPVNLVAPGISGTVAIDEVLTAEPGLWIYDTSAGLPVTSWQWRRAGSDISGQSGDTYTVQPGDSIQGLSVTQIETSPLGQRSANSASVGSAFSPPDDAALRGWWDADDVATIFQSTGIVSGWADKAGGAPLDQSNTVRRPRTATRTLNGRNVIDFDGSQFLNRTETLPASGDVAFHMALVIDSTASAFEAVLAIEATNDFQIDSNNVAQFDGRLNASGIATATNFSGGPFSGPLILSVVLDRTGSGNAEVFVSNTARASASYTTSIDSTGDLIVMANRATNAWVDGAVGELIVTGDVTNRAQHHAYLAAKWGLT